MFINVYKRRIQLNLELNLNVVQDNDIVTTIITAIETHNAIAFKYCKDIGYTGLRKVNPHNLYWSADNKNLLLDAVQVTGDSKTGLKSFKQFNLEYVKDVIILDEQFSIHKSYNSKSDRYRDSIIGIVD
jgi:hypothetical protein